jgi:N-acetylated-alpha-linked acidic dipeptidase
LIVMRAAAADVVPLKFKPYGLALREHVDELRRIKAVRVRKNTEAKPDADIDFVGLSTLIAAVRAFQAQAEQLDQATEKVAALPSTSARGMAKLNDALAKVERAFLLHDGLPGRPWFKHAVYAPGLTTGYAAWPLPAVRQGLEDAEAPDSKLATEVERTAARINKAADALETARKAAESMLNGR